MRWYDMEQRLREEIREAYGNGEFATNSDDALCKIVDGLVPVYTGDLLRLALDRLELATAEPEVYAFNGKHTAVNAIAANTYYDLLIAGQEYLEELEDGEEDKDDEEPACRA